MFSKAANLYPCIGPLLRFSPFNLQVNIGWGSRQSEYLLNGSRLKLKDREENILLFLTKIQIYKSMNQNKVSSKLSFFVVVIIQTLQLVVALTVAASHLPSLLSNTFSPSPTTAMICLSFKTCQNNTIRNKQTCKNMSFCACLTIGKAYQNLCKSPQQ